MARRRPVVRALIKAFFLNLATVAVLEVRHADFSTNLLPCVSEKVNLSLNVAWESYRAGEGRWTFMGIILRHPWEFSETSIWGPEFYTKWLIMVENDPTWSLECSHGRDQADGPGLRALIKAFFLILATVAVLEVVHADFRPICCPVSHKSFVVRAFRAQRKSALGRRPCTVDSKMVFMSDDD